MSWLGAQKLVSMPGKKESQKREKRRGNGRKPARRSPGRRLRLEILCLVGGPPNGRHDRRGKRGRESEREVRAEPGVGTAIRGGLIFSLNR